MLHKKLFVVILIMSIAVLMTPATGSEFQEGEMVHGFKLI